MVKIRLLLVPSFLRYLIYNFFRIRKVIEKLDSTLPTWLAFLTKSLISQKRDEEIVSTLGFVVSVESRQG